MKAFYTNNERYYREMRNYELNNRRKTEKDRIFTLKKLIYGATISCIVIHIIYSILFYIYSLNELFLYNIGSITFYCILSIWAKKGYVYLAFVLKHIEIILCTIFSTAFLGWQSGFYYLIFCFLCIIIIAPFKYSISKCIVAFIEIVIFLTLKFYAENHGWIYIRTVSSHFINCMYIYNVCIYFGEVLFLSIYNSRTMSLLQRKLYKQNKNLYKMATIDPLTKLFNRRAMSIHLKKTKDLLLKGKTFSIVICDIDDFKKVNDTYGHQCGDLVISTIASIISTNVEEKDVVCRWGGEEILMFFPDDDVKNAVNKVEQIRNAIEKHNFYYNNCVFKVTMTFGVSDSSNFESIDSIITKADDFLYIAKKRGKNCTVYNN